MGRARRRGRGEEPRETPPPPPPTGPGGPAESHGLERPRERALLAGCRLQETAIVEGAPLEELAELCEAAGVAVAGRLMQRRRRFSAATLFGSGKVAEIGALARDARADVIITENDLSPAQIRNIEETAGIRVVDRTELILDIFALRARTRQSQAQVELAQLQYLLPRLKRMWTHLERFEGGVGMRGPGETQLETDRRMLRTRISRLRGELEAIAARRQREVAGRAEAFTVSLVGYTNAGKSTLMRRLTGADVYVADLLFATLDTRSRVWVLPGARDVVLSDTVGFIRDLPHQLVASFHATLEEACHADLLLHVADAAHPDVANQIATVEAVLAEVGAGERPRLLLLNKMDRVADHLPLAPVRSRFADRLEISALTGAGAEALAARVQAAADADSVEADLVIPYADGGRLARWRARGQLLSEDPREDGVHVRARVRRSDPALAAAKRR